MYEYQRNVDVDPFAKAQAVRAMSQAEMEHVQRLQSQIGSQGNVLGGEPMRMPELSREAERIEMLIGQLGQLCNQLDARLTPVTRPLPARINASVTQTRRRSHAAWRVRLSCSKGTSTCCET